MTLWAAGSGVSTKCSESVSRVSPSCQKSAVKQRGRAAGYCPKILLLKRATMVLWLFHRSHKEICTQNRPVSETKFLKAPFSPGPFVLMLKKGVPDTPAHSRGSGHSRVEPETPHGTVRTHRARRARETPAAGGGVHNSGPKWRVGGRGLKIYDERVSALFLFLTYSEGRNYVKINSKTILSWVWDDIFRKLIWRNFVVEISPPENWVTPQNKTQGEFPESRSWHLPVEIRN